MAQRFPLNPLADDVEDLARSVASVAERLRSALPAAAAPHGTSYVLIKKAAELTGYTARAIEAKIAKGQWVEGREWIKAPDGHRMISLAGYAAWVERGGR